MEGKVMGQLKSALQPILKDIKVDWSDLNVHFLYFFPFFIYFNIHRLYRSFKIYKTIILLSLMVTD